MGDYDAVRYWKGWKKVRVHVRRLTVDDGAESVGSFAFDGFQNLTEAVLPDGLTRIGFVLSPLPTPETDYHSGQPYRDWHGVI